MIITACEEGINRKKFEQRVSQITLKIKKKDKHS